MKLLSKAHFLILLSLSLLVFNSCEKEGEKASSDLVGTWIVTHSDITVTVDGKDLVTFLMEAMELTQAEAEYMASIFAGEESISGTITFNSDNTYTAKFEDDPEENGTWSISEDGKTLNIKGSDGVDDWDDNMTIVSLTSSTLIISLPSDSETMDLDDDGVEETTMVYSMQITLAKQ